MMNDSNGLSQHENREIRLPVLSNQMVCFVMNHETYGIPMQYVLEVIKPQHFTIIPRSSSEVIGAINHLGKIFFVLDMAVILECKGEADSDLGSVILIKIENTTFGINVSKVPEITFYDEEILKNSVHQYSTLKVPFVKEYFLFEKNLINIMDIRIIRKQLDQYFKSR